MSEKTVLNEQHLTPTNSITEPQLPNSTFRILSLDGGGAKGFYTLGILDEIEKNTRRPISDSFDLIYGTSTGSIIAALLARGDTVATALSLYKEHVPTVMRPITSTGRTKALSNLAHTIFAQTTPNDFKTSIGIVASNWHDERPFIFKSSPQQAYAAKASFIPFFGCSIADAVVASCSAFPFFERPRITKSNGDTIELGDGGFCANNPSLYAIADATQALGVKRESLRVISLGVGSYPSPSPLKRPLHLLGMLTSWHLALSKDFLQKILGINTQSMETLREHLFVDIKTVRISDTFTEPEMATDLMEFNLNKLNRLTQKGRDSYRSNENRILELLASPTETP